MKGRTAMFAKRSAPKTPTLILISVVFLIIAVLFATLGIMRLGEKPVVDAATVKYSDISTENEYSFSELCLVDVYAAFWEDDEDNVVEYDYIVCFYDSTGALCYASLEVSKSSDISKTCLDYLNDDKLQPGDVLLSGCFSCYALDKQSDDIDEDFAKLYNDYNAEAPGVKTNLHFKYDGANAEEFAENRKTEATIFIIAGAIFFIIAAVIITLLVVSFKKAKKLSDVVTEGCEAPDLMMNQSAPNLMMTQDESTAEENKEE
jgi:flagellar basal body-associated protein FliL